MPFYAVASGRVPGIYLSWQECCKQVHKFKSSKYKKFKTKEEAEEYISKNSTNEPSLKPNESPSSIENQINQPLSKSIQFPSLTSIASTIISTNSRDSIIVDKVIKNRSENIQFSKRNFSSISTSSRLEDTIILSDDEKTPKKQKSPLLNEDIILIEDDEDSRSKLLELVKKSSDQNTIINNISSKNSSESTESESQINQQSNRNEINSLGNFIPLSEGTAHDENESKNILQQNQLKNRGHVVVYTDGACSNNGQANAKAGVGVWWGRNDPRNLSEPLSGKPTNNRAEIWAAIKAINRAADEGYDSITVCSDSDFLIKSAKFWVFKWRQNGWLLPNKKKVANREDFIKLIQAMERIKVVWEKVKSHIGILGNEEADRLANEAIGVRKSRRNQSYPK